jgi:hypothetical protein
MMWMNGITAISERRFTDAAALLEQAHHAAPESRNLANDAQFAATLAKRPSP